MLDDFRLAMRRRELARGTIAHRICTVRLWLRYLDAANVTFAEATRHDVERWLDGRHMKPRARYAAISHLHMFYGWAQREGHVDADPTAIIERPRLPRMLPRPMPELFVDLALASAPPDVRVMIALEAWAALRCCEVAWLDWRDVDLEAGTMLITGKGRRQRAIPIGARLRAELLALDTTTGPVIGRRLTPGRVSQLINDHLRANGIPFTAHALRHRKLTKLCELTGDLLAVQEYAGHASVATTQVYVALAAARVRALAELGD